MTKSEEIAIVRKSGCWAVPLRGGSEWTIFDDYAYNFQAYGFGSAEAGYEDGELIFAPERNNIRRKVARCAKAHPRLAAALADGLTSKRFATEDEAWSAIESLL